MFPALKNKARDPQAYLLFLRVQFCTHKNSNWTLNQTWMLFMQLLRYIVLFILINGSAHTQAVKIIGSIEQPVLSSNSFSLTEQSAVRSISLLNIQLSEKAQRTIQHRIKKTLNSNSATFTASTIPEQLQLGMNNVPVLDQGSHGTCVTFANTAAIDAALNKGDYISQLCQLVLGRYLESNSYTFSGWDGSWGPTVLNQMNLFGIVSKEQQRAYGCAGLTEYPMGGSNPMDKISLSEYHLLSEQIPDNRIAWTFLLEPNQATSDAPDMDKILNDIKIALNTGDRLTFGVLLLDFTQGMVGAVGTHRAKYDSWVLTPEIANDINDHTQFAGHEMIITGYDDHAIAADAQGRKYVGLLTLRNSWGTNIGDKGNFYMSYDYFKALTLEIQRIRHLDH